MDTFDSCWNTFAMPNQPATPTRSVRVPDDLWADARRIAAEKGETVSQVIVRALETYVRTHGEDEQA